MSLQAETQHSKTRRKRTAAPPPDRLTLCYQLAELPSAQHRAGLAGLVLMARYLERIPGPAEGTFRLSHVDRTGATVEVDAAGLARVFDELYAASVQEVESSRPPKEQDTPPKREEVRQERDAQGNLQLKKVYIYETVVPRGGMLVDWTPDRSDRSPWMKLWRDMLFGVVHGLAKQRGPFNARSQGKQTSDAQQVWAQLTQSGDPSVEQASTYLLGAQASTAENVPFRDRARYHLLLRFWPYVAQIYVPRVPRPQDSGTDLVGYVLAVPDVADLEEFCQVLPLVLQARSSEMLSYRPRDCVIDLVEEGALDLAHRLRRVHKELREREGSRLTAELVLGFDVFYLNKEGNNIRLLSSQRIEPEETLLRAYERCRSLQDPIFRRQVLRNLLDGHPWYWGFDGLARQYPHTKLIGTRNFRSDARNMFEMHTEEPMEQQKGPRGATSLEALVYRIVQTYVREKLRSKYGLAWDSERMVKGSEERNEFSEKKEKIAREAFLAVRARTGADFVDYFSGTLCSVRQFLPEADYALLAAVLRDPARVDELRTLTLLALSAAS